MGTRRTKTDGPPPERQTPGETPATRADFLTAAGKWAAGITATVLSAVLIYYLTGKQPPTPPKPPENAGLTHYDHLSGVLSLDYPSFLAGVVHKDAPDAISVVFGAAPDDFVGFMLAPRGGFMQVDLRPAPPGVADRLADAGPILEAMRPPPVPWWRRVMKYDRIVTTQRGLPPRKWVYLERELGTRVIGPSDVILVRHEVLDGVSVGVVAFVPQKTRNEYRDELDKALASITVNAEAARAFFAKPYYEAGYGHAKEKRFADAERALQRALAIDPMHKNARSVLARVFHMRGDHRLAWDQVHALQKMGVQVNETFLQRLRADYPEPQ